MKKVIGILMLAINSLVCLQNANAQKKIVPPGTEKMGDNVYLDKELLNWQAWREYTYWVQRNLSQEEFQKIIPDTNVMEECGYSYSELMRGVINEKSNFPIVGITLEQAENYCKWRSDRVEEKFKKRVTYTLPNADDYKMYADFVNDKRKTKASNFNLCEYTAEKEFVFCGEAVKGISPDMVNKIGFRCKATVENKDDSNSE